MTIEGAMEDMDEGESVWWWLELNSIEIFVCVFITSPAIHKRTQEQCTLYYFSVVILS